MLNDGGFQHSAGAQFADSIAVSGVAAVSNVRAGHRRWSKPRCIAVCVRLALNRGAGRYVVRLSLS